LEIKKNTPLMGIVTARDCPSCGHHEVGFTTEDGIFHSLKPGTFIQVLEKQKEQQTESKELGPSAQQPPQSTESEPRYNPWVPEPFRGHRSLRLKYGVMVREDVGPDQMSGRIFEAAYVEKLRGLIEKEVNTPIAVILDQFFVAPHLASGDPRKIAFDMWQELEEIRGPVEIVKAWLDDPKEVHLADLIRPRTKEDQGNEPVGDAEMKKELEGLSLEEFLELL
jgi:hypothetical protein